MMRRGSGWDRGQARSPRRPAITGPHVQTLAFRRRLTLVSRVTGFLRDMMLGTLLGAGAVADAFFVAFRLPNHFRTIFGEGAFNAAYVPSYSRVLSAAAATGRAFRQPDLHDPPCLADVLLVLAEMFTPGLVRLLAPGFDADPVKFAHAVR